MFDRIFRKMIPAKLIVSILLFFSGCAATTPNASLPTHVWEGNVTGMIIGKMTLTFQNSQAIGETKVVSGRLILQIESTTGGYGTGNVKGTLNGEIKNGLLEATFHGLAFVTDGQASVSGKLSGTLSDTKGQGNWYMSTQAEAGDLSGNWTLHKK